MTGRPRNPYKPPAVKGVRLTLRAYKKMTDHHMGNEPYTNTIERIIDELVSLRKKSQALQMRTEGLAASILEKDNSIAQLIKIQHKQAEAIAQYER
jgi:hypothetical protein